METIKITHPDKILFPADGITKKEVADYYERISEFMLPHLKDRPLMMQRFPEGIGESGFYQKNVSEYFPDWIERIDLEKEGGTVTHVLCNDLRTLLYLVNQNTLSFHTWLSKAGNANHPDKLVIDLDPSGDKFSRVKKAAIAVRKALDEENIASYPLITGSRGIHVIIELDGREDYDKSREAGRALGRLLQRDYPDLFTMESLKKDREGKLYFDIQRNAYAQTAITPYSLRPRKGAPVAVPVDWDELSTGIDQADKYTMGNIFRRMASKKQLWENFGAGRACNAAELNRKFRSALDQAPTGI